jgi:hypothetical protein
MIMKYLLLPMMGALLVFTMSLGAQDVAYCKHGQTGQVIVIEANMACPMGYYRI